ncbi:MAG: helix-turn-helix domain-containing protein [Actinomycetota bacterium]|nr:helix-turn-helix domain-containing protein [Actinomycetota bacterium]
MGRPREFDTDEAMVATMEQFWAHGYEATSLSDLVNATGLGRASLYNAFGSKREMYLASLDRYFEQRIPQMLHDLETGQRGLDSLSDFFELFPAVVAEVPERAAQGCLIVNSSTESASTNPEVADRAFSYRQRLATAFGRALARAVELGEISRVDPLRADQLLLSAMGLFVTMRGGADLAEIRRLTDSVLATIELWRDRG